MTFRLALRALLSRPIRSGVLACGFGLGIAVMASLLGIGEVILMQARSPDLIGGGDIVIGGATGRVQSARLILSSVLRAPPLDRLTAAASPTSQARLYLVQDDAIVPIRARGGIPSLERTLGDPETAAVPTWTDTPADRAWTSPDPDELLRALDRFHPIPDVPHRADSWAEWLYFNGRAGTTRFYLTFLTGPRTRSGHRLAGVRLQLDRDGRLTSYAASDEIDEAALLAGAPDLTVGGTRVRLDGQRYRVTLDLPRSPSGVLPATRRHGPRITGTIALEATPGRSLLPLTIQGADGWLSGYVVPVLAGALDGTLDVGGETIELAGGRGYHDHNWGFWEGVSWQWGQVQHGELSFVYGRVRPPADAADPDRIPGFLAALGPDGPMGYSTRVSITEQNEPGTHRPRRVIVRARGRALDLTLDLTVEDAAVTHMNRGSLAGPLDFLQLRGTYHATGRLGHEAIDFTAAGAAETFRER